jgi:hypothetical protein
LLARGRMARRSVPFLWAWAVAEALMATRRHWSGIEPRTRKRLTELVTKSRGRPSNLSSAEKRELRKLVGELDLRALSRELGAVASPLPRGRGRRR